MFTLYMLIIYTIFEFVIRDCKIIDKYIEEKKLGYFIGYILIYIVLMTPMVAFAVGEIYLIIFLFGLTICSLYRLRKNNEPKNIQQGNGRWYKTPTGKLILFVGKQILTLSLIIIFTHKINIQANGIYSWLCENVLLNNGISKVDFQHVFVVTYVSLSGSVLIRLALDVVYKDIENYMCKMEELCFDGDKKAAKLDSTDLEKYITEFNTIRIGTKIGIIERIMILILLYNNQYSAIGFIMTIKSIARFKSMEHRCFAEYYLIGTLFSVFYTFICFEIFKVVLINI